MMLTFVGKKLNLMEMLTLLFALKGKPFCLVKSHSFLLKNGWFLEGKPKEQFGMWAMPSFLGSLNVAKTTSD